MGIPGIPSGNSRNSRPVLRTWEFHVTTWSSGSWKFGPTPSELAFQALESFVEVPNSAYSDSSLQAASLTILEIFVAICDLKIRAPEVTPFTVTAPPPSPWAQLPPAK